MDQRTSRKLLKYLLCIFISCNLLSVDAQCSTVSSNGDHSDQICASLHIYKDNSYSERSLTPNLGRGDWIFAGVVTDVAFDFYECWIAANETGARYPIIERGCPQEATYYISKDRTNFFKFYGKFLQFTVERERTFFLRCNITTDCPAATGCTLLCNRDPPRRYLVESERISLFEDGGETSTGVNYIIIVVVIAVIFLLLFIILLVVLFCRMRRKRRRRRQARDAVPVLINSNIPSTYQNGHTHGITEDPDFMPQPQVAEPEPTYSIVKKDKNNVDGQVANETSEC